MKNAYDTEVRQLLTTVLQADMTAVDAGEPLDQYGLGSIALALLLAQIEDAFSIEIDPFEMDSANFSTIQKIADYIRLKKEL